MTYYLNRGFVDEGARGGAAAGTVYLVPIDDPNRGESGAADGASLDALRNMGTGHENQSVLRPSGRGSRLWQCWIGDRALSGN